MSDIKDIKEDVKEIRSDIGVIKVTLAENTLDMRHHIRRTDLAESRIGKLEKYLLAIVVMMAAAGASHELKVFDLLKVLFVGH